MDAELILQGFISNDRNKECLLAHRAVNGIVMCDRAMLLELIKHSFWVGQAIPSKEIKYAIRN